MRPLIALTLSISILLGVRLFLQFTESLRAGGPATVAETTAAGAFSVDITLTFDAEADEFSLEPISIILRLQDKVLLERKDLVAAGEPLVIANVPGIVEGQNEFYVECTPKAAGAPRAHAIRLRIQRDGNVLADQTLWADAGQSPRGVILIDVPPSQAEEADDHDE